MVGVLGHGSQSSNVPVCSMSQRGAPKDCDSVLAWVPISHFRNYQKLRHDSFFLTPMGIWTETPFVQSPTTTTLVKCIGSGPLRGLALGTVIFPFPKSPGAS